MPGQRRIPVVLVVDDEPLLREVATEHFEDGGFEVLQAENGAAALTLLRERPDIKAVFTDVQMPGQPDGFALANWARELCPDCAIMVGSGRVAPERGELPQGARFVRKPYSFQEVVSTITEMLPR